MSTINDGGSAFPTETFTPYRGGGGHSHREGGMSLRDYFAAKAMQGIIIGNKADECALGLGAAKDAYKMADAMLKAREAS